jgi:hypothetical protein
MMADQPGGVAARRAFQRLVIVSTAETLEKDGPESAALARALVSLQEATRRLALTHAPEGTPRSPAAIIALSEGALDPEARRVLRAVSVFRPKPNAFTREAALAVTAAGPSVALDRLVDAGLLDRVDERPGEPRPMGASAAATDRFALHMTIADYARADCAPELLHEWHARAADHFHALLRDFDQRRPETMPYPCGARYETPEAADATVEWLHHQAFTTDRLAANLALARVYFDAFWWWGYYIDFPFCTRVLDMWSETQDAPEDRIWLAALRRFHEGYPTGYRKQGRPGWDAVEVALTDIRRLGGLDGPLAGLDDEGRRYLRALTDIFLATRIAIAAPTTTAPSRCTTKR